MMTGSARLTLERVDRDEYDATDHVVERRTLGFPVALGRFVEVSFSDFPFVPRSQVLVGGDALGDAFDPRGESA